jgi:hypothetical protein
MAAQPGTPVQQTLDRRFITTAIIIGTAYVLIVVSVGNLSARLPRALQALP